MYDKRPQNEGDRGEEGCGMPIRRFQKEASMLEYEWNMDAWGSSADQMQ